jgi:hypothetical protein
VRGIHHRQRFLFGLRQKDDFLESLKPHDHVGLVFGHPSKRIDDSHLCGLDCVHVVFE